MVMDKKVISEELARKRALLIMQVRSGQISAKEAARQLGVSRKTYYQWEQKALNGMMEALQNGLSGRPVQQKDQEKETLQKKVVALEKKLTVAEQTVEVRDLLHELEQQEGLVRKKKDYHRRKRKKR
jgi:predicted DNA-binding protein (UPF0251 family)